VTAPRRVLSGAPARGGGHRVSRPPASRTRRRTSSHQGRSRTSCRACPPSAPRPVRHRRAGRTCGLA